ncbi:MAG: hypothetical protein A4S09_03100 [Proteobacteria bacterium SG_bin7]|nr:MAG: hypothetical protein A4S09_03100 [Proteobacteria bacterium SG_bin7]
MEFTAPDLFSTINFLLVTFAVLLMYFYALRKTFRKITWVFPGTVVFLLIFMGVVYSGWVEEHPFPRLMILFGVVNLSIIFLCFSPVGTKISENVTVAQLILFQAFRLPLELTLHSWVKQETIPVTMTWSGSNLDILTGILALLSFRVSERNKYVPWVFNIFGTILLLNVMRVAILSSPLPFAWEVIPPLQLGLYLPYALIVPVCVGGALGGHLILFRKLMRRSR